MNLKPLLPFLLLASFGAFPTGKGTTKDGDSLPVLTVCEVLEQRRLRNDRPVALVGVLGSTDEGQWLFDKGCRKQVLTRGFAWENDIWLKWDPSGAPEPSLMSRVDQTQLKNKLDVVKQRNQLRDFRHGSLDFSDRWVVVLGRFQSRTDLKPPKGKGPGRDWGTGYGHLNGSPAQLLIKDGSVNYLTN